MKRRNTFVALALIVAVLVLGVGYALIAEIDFLVSGTASAIGNQENFNVYFNMGVEHPENGKIEDVENSEFVELGREYQTEDVRPKVTIIPTADNKATVSVKDLSLVGDTVTVKIPVENHSSGIAAELKNIQVTNEGANSEFFDVTSGFEFGTDKNVSEVIIEEDESAYLTITVELKRAVLADDVETTFSVEFAAYPQAPAN